MNLLTNGKSGYSREMTVLTEYETWQRAMGKQPTTVDTTRKVINRFLDQAQCSPVEYSTEHVVEFLASPDFSPNTRYAYFWHLKSFSEWLVITRKRDDQPMFHLRSPRMTRKPPRPVPGNSLPNLLEHASGGRTRMMILLAALQGLRVHEVAKIHSSDVDIYDGSIEVLGKGGKVAILPLHDEVRRAIVREQMPRDGYWFESTARPGRPILPAAVSKAVARAMKAADVPGTPHALRHFFGTELVRSGANLRVVQELMRHSSIVTTQGYVQVQGSEMRAALGNLRFVA